MEHTQTPKQTGTEMRDTVLALIADKFGTRQRADARADGPDLVVRVGRLMVVEIAEHLVANGYDAAATDKDVWVTQ